MDSEVSFGAWVSRRRKMLDLTQAEVAHCAGCSVPGLRKIEADERRPSRQLAERLAGCLQIPPDQHPLFLQAARGERRVEHLGTAWPESSDRIKPGSAHPTSNLPLPLTPLLGREAELAILARLLHDPQYRLLTLVGPGGIGKTRLALAAALAQQAQFHNGVYFVPLASLTSAQFIVPAIADALGFAFSGPVEPKTQLLNYLQQKHLLLVLDNLEHLLEAAGLLAELLQHTPGLKLLVTSRERLNLQGEWLFDLQGLPSPPPDQVEGVEAYSAVGLFVQSARRVQAGFELLAEDRPAVSRICQLVEGMPLAIELAAAWVPVLTCQEIAREIECNLDFLTNTTRNVPGRHYSLRATFDYSWNLLTPDERSVLGRLAVFQGGFEREAAEAVAGATLHSLRALTAKSLLRRQKSGRYDLHEVVRQYALAHLADDPQDKTATCQRHSDFYLVLLHHRETALKSAGQRQAIRELTGELDNVRAAWAWAVAHEKFDAIGPALRSFGWLFELCAWLREGIEQLEAVVQAIRAGPEGKEGLKVLGQALTQQGLLFFRWGRFDRAMAVLAESLTLLRRFNDPALLPDALVYSAIIMHLNGDYDRAQSLLAEGLVCAQAAGDHWFAAYARFNQGYIASLMGRYQEGYRHMSDSLAVWRAIGDPRSIALGLNFLSPTIIKLGHYEQAQIFLQESLGLCQQVGDRWGMGTAYRHLGLVALARGNLSEAEALLQQSLNIFNEFVTGWDIVRSLTCLGQVKAAAGNLAEARRIFLQTLPMGLEIQAIPLALDALVGLAELQAQTGQVDQALEFLTCVLHHPAGIHETRNRAGQLVVQLEARLSPCQLEQAQAKPLEMIVQEAAAL